MILTTLAPQPHRPLPQPTVIGMPDAQALARAALLTGQLGVERLPLHVRPDSPAASLAVTRTAVLLLHVRLQQLYPACPWCMASGTAVDCARELGALEARLAALADHARRSLCQVLNEPGRSPS